MQDFKTSNAKVNLMACPRCGKPQGTVAGSMTWWIFRRNCNCPPLPAIDPSDISLEPLPLQNGAVLTGVRTACTYKLVRLIAAGGMGQVYEAESSDGTKLAVKLVRKELAENPALRKRFEEEIEAVSLLTHENLIKLIDHGISSEGAPFLVMELLDGIGLTEELLRTSQDCSYALELFIQIAAGLSHAHSRNILHRDIKPSNIIVTTCDGTARAIIIDFGIAKAKENLAETQNGLTRTGEVVGTPLYLSPERCRGLPASERSEIYSFGCLMYEAVKGFPPFEGVNPLEIMFAHCSEQPEPIFKPDCPSSLSRLILQCLKKDPQERYASMQDVHSDLLRIRAQQPLKFIPKSKLITRRNAPWVAAIGILACSAAGLAIRESIKGVDILNQNSKAVIFSSKEKSPKAAVDEALRNQQDLSFADLHSAKLQGLAMQGKKFDHLNLAGANLQNSHVEGCLLDGIDLEGADLSRSTWDASMRDGNFKKTNFAFATIQNDFATATLDTCNFSHAQLENSILIRSNFKSCNLSGADISGNLAEGAIFSRCDMRNLQAAQLNAIQATFAKSDLTKADLHESQLSKARFISTSLSGSNLSKSNLRLADLQGIDLNGANLEGANLEATNLRGANLTNAKLRGAILTGADLTGANLKGAQYESSQLAQSIQETRLKLND